MSSRNEIGVCECCGAKKVEYRHGLSKSLLRPLVRFSRYGSGYHNPSDMKGMTHSQLANWQKLSYWGLIEKAPDETGKGGFWRITPAGWSFLKGRNPLAKYVWTFRGEWVRGDGPAMLVSEVTGGWKYRPEYAREARPV